MINLALGWINLDVSSAVHAAEDRALVEKSDCDTCYAPIVGQ